MFTQPTSRDLLTMSAYAYAGEFSSLFDEIRKQLRHTYLYPQGNCHNVSHFVSILLNRLGVPHRKVWMFAPCRYDIRSKESICLPDPNGLGSRGLISWGYHVGLLIDDTDKGGCVFDYFINHNRPMGLLEWTNALPLSRHQLQIEASESYLFHTDPHPAQCEGLFNGRFFRYEGDARQYEWMEKGLAVNQTAYDFFLEEIKSRPEGTLRQEYRRLVGSIHTFEAILRDQAIPAGLSTSFLQRHAQVLSHYQQRYDYYLAYWRYQRQCWESFDISTTQVEALQEGLHTSGSLLLRSTFHEEQLLSSALLPN